MHRGCAGDAMLDVFVGIGFTSVMILLIVFRAIGLDRVEPWFVPFKPRQGTTAGGSVPWRRKA